MNEPQKPIQQEGISGTRRRLVKAKHARFAIGACLLYLVGFHILYNANIRSFPEVLLYETIAGGDFFITKQQQQRPLQPPPDDSPPDILLEWDASRIPGYLPGSNRSSLFGYVMRDLSRRFLSPVSDQQRRLRQRAKRSHGSAPTDPPLSTILVVSPGANRQLSGLLGEAGESSDAGADHKHAIHRRFGYRIGPSFLVESVFGNGPHGVIAVDPDTGATFDYHPGSGATENHRGTDRSVLLAVFDPDRGREDYAVPPAWEDSVRNGSIEYATFRISSATGGSGDATTMRGIETFRLFRGEGYKLQVLSSSHAPTDGLNPYGPNTLLKNQGDVEEFLVFGVALATKENHARRSKDGGNRVFHSILFATRGLDLAIPSRREFLNTTDRKNDHVVDIEKEGIPFTECPDRETMATLRFRNDAQFAGYGTSVDGTGGGHNDSEDDDDDELQLSCFGRKVSVQETNTTIVLSTEEERGASLFVELWHSHTNLSLSEAACLRCTKLTTPDGDDSTDAGTIRNTAVEGKCSTRILPDRIFSESKIHTPVTADDNEKRGPNLLAIELRGVHHNMLNLSLSGFETELKNVGLERVSPLISNNGWNSTAWWSSVSEGSNGSDIGGHQRYRGINRCDRQTLLDGFTDDELVHPHHGSQISGMFCFDYDRPNCLFGRHAATHLLDHVEEFIRTKIDKREKWAAYITLVDGEEESETLVGTLKLPIIAFLSSLASEMSSEEWSNTIVAIYSDNERQPVLFLKTGQYNHGMTKLKEGGNSTFVWDLNYFMQSILTARDIEDIEKAVQRHLRLDAAVATTDAPLRNVVEKRTLAIDELIAPPSILSFYADIPKEQKFRLVKSSDDTPMKRALVVKGCQCATNMSPWSPCNEHPWDSKNPKIRRFKETFILVDCPGQSIHLEIGIVRNRVLTHRSKKRIGNSAHLDNINIIFLELDSVSLEYADRHFPKTRELLKKHRIARIDDSVFECPSGICSAEFPYTSLVGANSIPNQVAALSGCVSAPFFETCGMAQPKLGEICHDTSMAHNGLKLKRSAQMRFWCPDRNVNVTKTPWLFGVSDSKGYINFFGEEFCYDHSPYVTQGNVFPKHFFDIQSHKVFCSLVERKVVKQNLTINSWEKWGVDMSDPCVEGYSCSKKFEKSAISLQFIDQMWDVYSSRPKLAFLNVIAAHDYSPDWEMAIPAAENYDEHLVQFLKRRIDLADKERTVIFIRSDHGLQKGPMIVDYALQVEHRHPWTEILIPESLVISKPALFDNQARMLTGFDLYHTMRLLMSDRAKGRDAESGIPDWSYDVISEEIPKTRTCKEAKVDPDLCREVKQTRNFGVCNYLDPDQIRFCSINRIEQNRRNRGQSDDHSLGT